MTQTDRRPGNLALLVNLVLCVSVLGAGSAMAQWQATYLPTLDISRVQGEIEIDGLVDDAGWRTAAIATHFAEHQPGDQIQPPFRTVVRVAYDDRNLYVAFECFDEDPSQIRASFTRRDQINADDNVLIAIDTFGDAMSAYEIGCNPYGIQTDFLYSSSGGEDSSYDLIFTTAARITDQGWQAEFSIPFSSLRFPDTPVQTWKVDFWRNQPREVRTQASWAAYDRDESCWPCQWGTITGMENVDPASGLQLIPAFTANQAGERRSDGSFDNGDIKGEPSLTAKYNITSDFSAEASINPDFSQVESDAVQINVNSNFALFFPEKRPFFQEGSDLWNTYFTPIYTRQINDPSVAGKLLGRSGKTSFGVLAAYDEHSPILVPLEERSYISVNGKSMNTFARVRTDLGGQSHVGFVATDRRYDSGGNGSLLGVDTRWRLNPIYQLEAQYLHSFTTEPDDTTLTMGINGEKFDGDRHTAGFDGETFDGGALYASFERHGRSWGFDFDYWDFAPTFRAESGFEVRNSYREGIANTDYMFRFNDSTWLDYLSPGVRIMRTWNYDDIRKDEAVEIWLSGRLRKAQASFHAQYKKDAERYRDTDYRGLDRWHICGNARPSDLIIIGANANYGRRIYYRERTFGMQSDFGLWFDVKPMDRLLLETSFNWSRSEHEDTGELFFDSYVMRSKLGLQITRELSARIIVQYNGFYDTWEGDPLLQYQINPFSIFYVGSTRDYAKVSVDPAAEQDWRLTHRQYFMKMQYLFGI
ncbi:MAG: carbohydrate binding family 9 domain-containing protein [bacterium]|nr:carbohydrate binding family 9 domain-containing protein [bacterium]